MHFDCSHTYLQHFRNLTVRVPDRHQAKDVTLPRREEISVDLFLYRLDFSAQSSSCAHQ
jgi:hypothetical protein